MRDEVRRRIDDLAPGGGFIFNTVHNIQADVPPEDIVAMRDALANVKDFETVLGEYSFTAGRDADYTPIGQIVKNGKFAMLSE